MTWSRERWMGAKVALARRLAARECGGDYPEAIMVLTSAMSAIAAEIWPGEGIDRKRFVEVMCVYCDPQLKPTRISIPLLVGHLRRSGKTELSTTLRNAFMDFHPSQVLTGDDVDHPEEKIISACQMLTSKEVRVFSYANTLYREVRSAFVHEYRLRGKADMWTMAEDADAKISYGNWMGDPDRHIHFPVGWVSAAASSVAKAADTAAAGFPRARPAVWWIDGA